MALESFGLAAGKFAIGFVSGRVRDNARRSKLEDVYTESAWATVDYFCPNGGSGPSDVKWVSVNGLLRDPDFGSVLAFRGKAAFLDLRELQSK